MSWRESLHEHCMMNQHNQYYSPTRSGAYVAEPTRYCVSQSNNAVQQVERVIAAYTIEDINKQELLAYLDKWNVPTLIQCEIIEFAEESLDARRSSKRSK